ncbi:MAG TPA: hypothetical protein DCP71_15940 [Verrucomicrobiales bacterium]|nr:hypothetical protein [Verrucomicrobiales bacterium]
MTSPVAPDAAPSVPEFPALGDPSFNSKAYTWGTWIPTLVTWITNVVADAYQNALSAFESATASASSAATAALSAQNAAGTANFKGTWSSLGTISLAPPAAASHEGITWNLLSAVADVSLAEPGVSPVWEPLSTVFPIEDVNAATVTMVSGNEYNFKYAGVISATMPAMVEGAAVVVTITNDRRDNVLLRANPADSFMGKSPDDITLLTPGRWALRVVNGSWRGF